MRRLWPWIVAAAGYTALACVRLWPLVHHAGGVVTRPGDDALLNAWILWWNVHAIPLTNTWWNAPIFYPVHGAMAFSELLLGELLITAPVQWLTHNPVLAHNAAVLLSFPLCALAAHALAFELTKRHDAATLAGLAFGFGAIRANYIGHVQMLSYYWAPVALVCLHRSLRASRSRVWLVCTAFAVLLQVLCNGYALFQLPLLLALWIVWFPSTLRQRAAASAAVAAGLLPMVPILLRYQAIHTQFGFERSLTEIRLLSADAITVFQAHAQNVVLGRVISAGAAPGLFPGLTVAALVVVAIIMSFRGRSPVPTGLTWDRRLLGGAALAAFAVAASVLGFGPWSIGPLTVSRVHKPLGIAFLATAAFFMRGPRWRAVWRSRSAVGFYALSAALFFLLSFGPEPRVRGERFFYQAPYSWLMHLPGFQSIRAPDRLALLGVLALAIVVALTYARWSDWLGTRKRIVWLAVCAALAIDGAFWIDVQPTPATGPRDAWPHVEAVVELPLTAATDASTMYRSMRPGPALVNGTSGYAPPHYPFLREALAAGDFAALKTLGLAGDLGIAIDPSATDAASLERSVRALDGAVQLSSSNGWARYVLTQSAAPPIGELVQIARVTAFPSPEDASRMIDGQWATAWSAPEATQNPEVVVELSAPTAVMAVGIRLRDAWFQAPQDLSIEASMDGTQWVEVRRGRTAAAMVPLALENPLVPQLRIAIPETTTRFIRLREHESRTPTAWAIAELAVYRR